MSKSLGNTIYLTDSAQEVTKKVKAMYTDPNRIRASDPGKVEGNPVFIYHDAFNKNINEVNDLKERYRNGTVGDIEVKTKLAFAINEVLEPIRERRRYFERHLDEVYDMLRTGNQKVSIEGKITLEMLKSKMGINYKF